MKKKILFVLLLVFAISASLFVGCAKDNATSTPNVVGIQAEFIGFEKIGENKYFKKVSNETDVFSLGTSVKVNSTSIWQLSSDVYGNNVISSKTATLLVGDNNYYVNVIAEDGTMQLYTLNIRRREIYTVTFAECDAQSQYIEEDSFAIAPTTANRKGYTFENWDFDFSKPIVKNTYVYATWNAIEYKIDYELNGGVNNSENPSTYTIENTVTLKNPTRENYEFIGWFTDSTFEREIITIYRSYGNKKLYAKWLSVYEYSSDTINGLTDYGKKLSTLSIPSQIDGNTIKKIGNSAFKNCGNLTSIIIENGLMSIGDRAFYNCVNLNEVTIMNNLRSIGDSAFIYCSSLANITIPNSMTTIGDRAFEGCDSLTNIYISDLTSWCNISGLHNLMNNDSAGSKNLYLNNELITNLIIPTTVISISNSAFENCSNLISVSISNKVTTIGASAFNGCYGLTSVIIPNNVETIGEDAFSRCRALTSMQVDSSNRFYYSKNNCIIEKKSKTLVVGCKNTIVPTDDSIVSIGNSAFNGCYGLARVVIPDSVTTIGERAFFNCRGLSSVTMGDGVLSIGEKAFENCSSLTSITIPKSVAIIDDYAFENCYKLIEIINNSNLDIVKGGWKNGEVGYYALNVKRGGATDIVNKNDYLFYTYNNVHYMLGYVGNDTELILPGNYNGESYQIYKYAFAYCDNYTSVDVGNGATVIGESSFNNCKKIVKITIGNSVKTINNSAFLGCRSLMSVTFPNSLEYIGEYAFGACYALTSVVIPHNVTHIDDYAFSWCYKLVEVINNSDLRIKKNSSEYGNVGYYALNIKKGESTDIINKNGYLFYTYNSVDYLLGYVGKDTELTLPENYNGENYQIYKYAFSYCNELTSITIPCGVVSIGNSAFSNCSSLKTIYYKGTEEQWKAIKKGSSWISVINYTVIYNA